MARDPLEKDVWENLRLLFTTLTHCRDVVTLLGSELNGMIPICSVCARAIYASRAGRPWPVRPSLLVECATVGQRFGLRLPRTRASCKTNRTIQVGWSGCEASGLHWRRRAFVHQERLRRGKLVEGMPSRITRHVGMVVGWA
jgi:hypothetical protein